MVASGQMGGPGTAPRLRYARPPVDIYSTEGEVVVLADLPGVRKESLDVRIEGDELVIEARVSEREESESRLPWGYLRRFQLSTAVDRERIAARLENGVLEIKLPKRGSGEARRVNVE